MDAINDFVNAANSILFSEAVVFALLGTGILFTIWSGFGQYRALTHGVAVIRGKYDKKGDPGAINHFQALSAALSATVGLGNIGGVAVAVAVGGPGAVLWMWVIGVVGMALKMTEVTQSMLYRNTTDPANPHGGPMFVVRDGLRKMGLGPVGSIIGGIFVITLLISAITGGNMFQAWNVAEVTNTYFKVPQIATGMVLAVMVGAVIIGGIKRIGSVAGRLVPFMCVLYLLAAAYVLVMNAGEIPSMLALIVRSGLPPMLGGESAGAGGAFLGGTFGFAAMWGIKRALFSSEAGQGSAPIAHSAAKTDEPVREGVVAGLEPFIDTIVVCTMTSLVILSTGAWNRDAEAMMPADGSIINHRQLVFMEDGQSIELGGLIIAETEADLTLVVADAGRGKPVIRTIPRSSIDTAGLENLRKEHLERIRSKNESITKDGGTPIDTSGLETPATSYLTIPDHWVLSLHELPPRTAEARRISGKWEDEDDLFAIVQVAHNADQGTDLARLYGDARESEEEGQFVVSWRALESDVRPTLDSRNVDSIPIFGDYPAASMTAHAFDIVTPGLGKWLVTLAAWLFAISTMISWSYYGEQGVVYLAGEKMVLPYKVIYCGLVVVSTLGFITTDAELDMWTTLGLGVMLVANIPIMLIFGPQAMKAYHAYMDKLKSGGFAEHEPQSIEDVVEGREID